MTVNPEVQVKIMASRQAQIKFKFQPIKGLNKNGKFLVFMEENGVNANVFKKNG